MNKTLHRLEGADAHFLGPCRECFLVLLCLLWTCFLCNAAKGFLRTLFGVPAGPPRLSLIFFRHGVRQVPVESYSKRCYSPLSERAYIDACSFTFPAFSISNVDTSSSFS